MYPPSGVRQALMTTVSRAPDAGKVVEEAEVPRPLWLLGGAGGKTIVELVLLNLVRGGGGWGGGVYPGRRRGALFELR